MPYLSWTKWIWNPQITKTHPLNPLLVEEQRQGIGMKANNCLNKNCISQRSLPIGHCL
jgi:hypothetical protein